METIIKSILNTSGDETALIINQVLSPENQNYFSSQETQLFEEFRENLKELGKLPTESYFLNEHPEYEVPLSKAKVLSEEDLKIRYKLLLRQRINQDISKTLMQVAGEVKAKGFTPELQDRLADIKVDQGKVEKSTTDTPEAFLEYYRAKKDKPIGLLSFIPEIDEAIGGLPMGGISTIFGFVANGKSTYMLNCAYNNAKKENYNVVIISLEVSKEDVLIQLLSRHSNESKFTEYVGLPHQKIRQCKLNEKETDYFTETILPDFYKTGGKIKILDETDFATMSKAEVRAKLEDVDDEFIKETGKGIDGVFVDYINLFKFGAVSKNQNEYAVINEYVSYFRKLALNFRKDKATGEYRKIHVMVAAQANREGWARAVKNQGAYDLRAIAEANELEKSSIVVLSIYTDENLKLAKEANMCLLKNRYGPVIVDPVAIKFDPEMYNVGSEDADQKIMMSSDELSELVGSDDFDLGLNF